MAALKASLEAARKSKSAPEIAASGADAQPEEAATPAVASKRGKRPAKSDPDDEELAVAF
jgi:hypothetical protein